MIRKIFFVLCCLPIGAVAQRSDFAKNYAGAFYVTGYYLEDDYSQGYRIQNGVDFKTIGLFYARRLAKNVYIQSNGFLAGNGGVYLDAGIKLNAFVHHKLQPFGCFTIGNRLGIPESSIFYYSFGLDYHLAPSLVLQSSVFSDIGNYAQGLRFGVNYKI
jgi:hypothetical protein